MIKVIHFNVHNALSIQNFWSPLAKLTNLQAKDGLQLSTSHVQSAKPIVLDAVKCMFFVLGMDGQKVVDVHAASKSQLHFS